MIRINLLPQAKKSAARAPSASGGGAAWGLVYFAAVLMLMVALGIVWYVKKNQLTEQQQANEDLQQRIEQIKQKSARLEQVKSQLEQSRRLEEVVAELNKARTGPTRMLMEMSKILSDAEGPTIDPQDLEECRRVNPLCGFNRSWDVRRLWVTEFHEDNRQFTVRGRGKTNEDVAEFHQRLRLSELFENVALTKTEAVTDDETRLGLIGFELTGRVRY